ncbi:hypothetical protein PFISCL1PPCAC_23028, partial [Pristionchus fissidentatus]
NLVYYKDVNGVVRGPLCEDEATSLLKADFFRSDHVFRVVDAAEKEQFSNIADLRSLNGFDTPFMKVKTEEGEKGEEKESIRVYK